MRDRRRPRCSLPGADRPNHGRAFRVARVHADRQLGEARSTPARALVGLHLKGPPVIHALHQREDTHTLVAVVLIKDGHVVRVTIPAGNPRGRRRRRTSAVVIQLRRHTALVARPTHRTTDQAKTRRAGWVDAAAGWESEPQMAVMHRCRRHHHHCHRPHRRRRLTPATVGHQALFRPVLECPTHHASHFKLCGRGAQVAVMHRCRRHCRRRRHRRHRHHRCRRRRRHRRHRHHRRRRRRHQAAQAAEAVCLEQGEAAEAAVAPSVASSAAVMHRCRRHRRRRRHRRHRHHRCRRRRRHRRHRHHRRRRRRHRRHRHHRCRRRRHQAAQAAEAVCLEQGEAAEAAEAAVAPSVASSAAAQREESGRSLPGKEGGAAAEAVAVAAKAACTGTWSVVGCSPCKSLDTFPATNVHVDRAVGVVLLNHQHETVSPPDATVPAVIVDAHPQRPCRVARRPVEAIRALRRRAAWILEPYTRALRIGRRPHPRTTCSTCSQTDPHSSRASSTDARTRTAPRRAPIGAGVELGAGGDGGIGDVVNTSRRYAHRAQRMRRACSSVKLSLHAPAVYAMKLLDGSVEPQELVSEHGGRASLSEFVSQMRSPVTWHSGDCRGGHFCSFDRTWCSPR